MECCSFIDFTGDRNDAVVILHHFFNDGQADAGTGIFLFAVKSLKHFKNAVFILRVEANPIIRNRDVAVGIFRYKVFLF